MKRFPLFLLFTLFTLSTVPAQADIIDDTLSMTPLAIFSRRLTTLITLTVGETMKIRATTAGSVK